MMYVLLIISLIGTVAVFVFVAIILKLVERESDSEQRDIKELLPQIPLKCQELRVAELLPWWCHMVCARTGTKLCYWACKPIGKQGETSQKSMKDITS